MSASQSHNPFKEESLPEDRQKEGSFEVSRPADLYHLFVESVNQYSTLTAISFEGASLSYSELANKVEDFSETLAHFGIEKGDRVGLSMPRSIDAFVALLAIYKSGATCIPIDPTYPESRVHHMVSSSKTVLLITAAEAHQPDSVAALTRLTRKQDTNYDYKFFGEVPLAYIIYTSGSTGHPKGVALPQRALINLVQWQMGQDYFPRQTRTLQYASLSFDVAYQEIFSTLLSGGTLFLVDESTRRDPAALFRYLQDNRIQRLFLPYVAMKSLAEFSVSTNTILPDLRELYTAGEQLIIDTVVQKFFKNHPDCFLENQYGPTESHVVTHFKLTGDPSEWPATPPIGHAISNTRVHILSNDLQPCLPGERGEICISGDCLALGYIGDDELTKQRFTHLPALFPENGNEKIRIYRTGDYGTELSDGALQFLGREDDQVKIRGYRIETGEIEAVLGNHHLVRQAVVIAFELFAAEKSLAAFIKTHRPVNVDTIHEDIRLTLPDYMIPNRFLVVDKFPLTPSGKVDRKALRDQLILQEPIFSDYEDKPDLPLRERLIRLWRSAIGNPQIDLHSRFIDEGGHSLIAMRIIAQLRNLTAATITVSDLLRNPTVDDFAKQLEVPLENSSRTTAIERVSREERLVLSNIQENIFLDAIKNAEQPTYNEPWMVRIKESLDPICLEQALKQLIERHEILRTCYQIEDGALYQQIQQNPEVDLPLKDFSHLPKESAEQEVAKQAKASARKHLDLQQGQVIRCTLYKLSHQDYRLLLTVHHIMSDVTTVVDVLVPDIIQLYRSLQAGNQLPTGEKMVQYADFAAWERSQQGSKSFATSLDYWKEKLAYLPVFELPGNRPRPAKLTRDGFKYIKRLNEGQAKKLETYARRSQETVFNVSLTAFKALLAFYTGSTDIVVGSISAGRDHPQTESMAGCFLNYLILRTQLDGDPTFSEQLNRVKQTNLEALQHQAVSYNHLLQTLKPERNPSYTPFYQIMFFMETATESRCDGWFIDQMEVDVGISKIDLTVGLDIQDEELILFAEHNRNLYDPEFIDELLTQFTAVIETVCANVNFRISTLAAEVKEHTGVKLHLPNGSTNVNYPQIFNNTIHPLSGPLRLQDILIKSSQERPDATAVEFGKNSLSYRQLNRMSNGCAKQINEAGVSKNDVVAVLMRRSEKVPIAVFGILKAGAVYMPVDPDFPPARIQHLLKNSGAKLVILDSPTEADKTPDLDLLFIQEVDPVGDYEPPQQASPADPAYAIYTSGSTGKPKGALISHHSIVNRLSWMADQYGFSDTDCQLLKTPLTFDVSVHELFLWSFVGAKLAISVPGSERDPAALVKEIQNHGVTRVHFVPSMLAAFLAHVSASNSCSDLTTLKDVFCSGEALPGPLVHDFYEQLGHVNGTALHNLYGPTEAAVDVTYFNCLHYTGQGSVPIGKPVWNTHIYLLDEYRKPVAMGQAGELYIGGAQVGLGYLNQPELTSEVFLSDPFSKDLEARMYKTGDLARWLPGGDLEYLGRTDFQIKIRGIRIDPNEIEDVLLSQPGVARAVVIASANHSGSKKLIAYIECSQENEVSPLILQTLLEEQLPSYLVPSNILILKNMPLTSSGKIDRKALPLPQALQPDSKTQFQPQTVAEKVLAEAWKEILQVENLYPNSDIFELGGDSILAIQLVSHVRRKDYQLPLSKVFECSDFQSMAANMSCLTETPEVERPDISRNRVNPIQRWFLDLRLRHPNHWNQSNLIHFKTAIREDILKIALVQTFENHLAFNLRFEEEENGWFQCKQSRFQPPKFQVVEIEFDNSTKSQIKLNELCAEAQTTHDLSVGRSCSTVFFRSKDGTTGSLFISIHHLIIDQISWRILLEDLDLAYEQLSRKQPVQLPAEITTPLTWIEALRNYSKQPNFKKETAYWNSCMPPDALMVMPELEIAGDDTEESTETAEVSLASEETYSLVSKIHAAYNTEINDILLAALVLSLQNTSQEETVSFYLEGHGREPIDQRHDLSRTIGWFTTLFPVTIRCEKSDTESVIKNVKEYLRSIPHHGIGYGLDSCFEPGTKDNKADRTPEIIFNYLGQTDRVLNNLEVIDRATPMFNSEKATTNHRICSLEVLCWIEQNEFKSQWFYSRNRHSRKSIEQLAKSFLSFLRQIIDHCQSSETGGYTPSDFKTADLTQDQLDDILSSFD